MRELIDRDKFFTALTKNLETNGYDVDKFVEAEPCKIMIQTILDIPMEDRYYSEKDMDYYVKINMRLLEKFRPHLVEEYGNDWTDIFKMFNTLYIEQNNITPEKWYEYCCK